MGGRAGPIMVTWVAQPEIDEASKIAAAECKRCFIAVVISKREAGSRATSFLVIPSASRGIRHETFKVMQRDPAHPSHKATARQATVARDDQCVFPFHPLRIAFAW